MDRCAEATWGAAGREAIRTAAELDALLDRVDREARLRGRPQDVALWVPGGAGTLGVVVGHDRSVLNHVPDDGDPPYRVSCGDEDEDRPYTYFVGDDHHSEAHWRHTIPGAQARRAARTFLLTGRLDEALRWEEV